MLPLSRGSVVVVDASEKAVKSGQTCPDELIKLYKKGVKIYSASDLHSKIYVLGNKLFIGSANVSSRSKNVLKEAMMLTEDRKAVSEAKSFVDSLVNIELGIENLKRLKKIYRPPQISNGTANRSAKINEHETESPLLHIFHLTIDPCTEEQEKQAEKGRVQAGRKRINRRHILDEFMWFIGYSANPGDFAIQVVEERDKIYVSPPGTVIHIRTCYTNESHYSIFFVEIPILKRKSLKWIEKHLSKNERKSLKRNGRVKKELATKLLNLWK